ncbi:MAG: pyridoxamine kinase [Lachnospiraceae bacterium]|nr:pyridoxamine kinase [Lachnospiraceae bacterium]
MLSQIKVLTIQDISCTGRCSITVALPMLSACGFNTSVIPTSLLSTHTGGFDGYFHRDLTGDMEQILAHWKTLDLKFDAIYIGFLANEGQVDNAIKFIEALKTPNTMVFVDPAMADEGELYSLLEPDFPDAMRKLLKYADLICPNMTEAYMLLGDNYEEGALSDKEIKNMAYKLALLSEADVVITGVETDDGAIGAACYNRGSRKFKIYTSKKVEGVYYGAGDVFMCALIGGMLHVMTLEQSMKLACDFVVDCIERSKAEGTDYRYGVDFERGIPLLLHLLGITK